ncbi:A24 family peptidase [Desulfofundulus kuznetsovii]|uniref:A24 family peptidase n=1 Tax=Desulfofundulus kuznetsovii TaxID=58135 RepID=UPI00338DC91B
MSKLGGLELIRAGNLAFVAGCLLPSVYIAYTDARSHMIYDRATFPILLAGLVNALHSDTLPDALLGSAFAFALLFICAALGGAGGGDVKYAAGLGMWFGFLNVQYVLLIATAMGVVWGMVKLAWAGRLKSWAKTFLTGLFMRVFYGVKGAIPLRKLPDNPGAPVPPEAVPFGTCLAVGSWVVFIAGW